MSKKAQGMSMNVIIIAALALLVLVILAIIFIGRMGSTTRGVDQCKGNCVSTEEDCTNQGPYYKVVSDPCYIAGTKNFDRDRPICCVGV
jgi:flagellar basal body-associated protein FliL